MPRIFISYRRTDSSTISGRIYDHLVREFGDGNVFKDVYDIPVGSDFRKVIQDAINSCSVQLVIIGPNWLNTPSATGTRRLDDANDFVRIEVETGLNCKDILLIPVLVSGANMPPADQLPDVLRDLSFRNAIFIRDDPDFRNDIEHLIESLQRGYEVQVSRLRRRWPYVAIFTLLAAIIIILVGYIMSGTPTVAVNISTATAVHPTLAAALSTETLPTSTSLPATPTPVLSTETSLPPTPTNLPPTASAPAVSVTPRPGIKTLVPKLTHTPRPTSTAAAATIAPTRDTAGAVALIRQGDDLQAQGSFQAAQDKYSQAIALDPNNAEAYISRASVTTTLGTDFNQAISDAEKAIALDPKTYWNYDELGKIYFALENYDAALIAFNQALDIQPYAQGYYGRALVYHALGDLPGAISDLNQSLQLDPTNMDAVVERGWTEYDSKDYSSAIEDFSAALEKDPTLFVAYYGRANAYRDSGDLDQSYADYKTALSIDPTSGDTTYDFGYAHELNGENDEARRLYEQALQLQPSQVDAHLHLAELLVNQYNDPQAALEHAQRATQLASESPEPYAVLGDVYYALGQKQDALEQYAQYLQRAGDDPDQKVLDRIHELQGT